MSSVPLSQLVPVVGHFGAALDSGWWFVATLGASLTALVALCRLHHRTKSAQSNQASQPSPMAGVGLAGVAICGIAFSLVAASVVAAPAVTARQSGEGLPDLISDPPKPGFLKTVRKPEGKRLMLTFDGYVHNIGNGPLDVVGNPQVEGGMVQRVRSNGRWQEVSKPTVRYETDDGHNHFHLIETVDYVLWNQTSGEETMPGSKIGFCLVDSEQMEPGSEQAYSEELDNFCEEDNPGATSVRMGISPGWRDIYDATTTLQWVDVSEVAPGRYWIGAITDPNDEIVESDETNNALVLSRRPAIVPGWKPQSASYSSGGETVEIDLGAQALGTVGSALFAIDTVPGSGQVSSVVGATQAGSTLTYTPDPGFAGMDSFEFSVRDSASEFPLVASSATITIEVSASAEDSAEPGTANPGDGEILDPDSVVGPVTAASAPTIGLDSTVIEGTVGERLVATFELSSILGEPVSLHASNLAPGLSINDDTVSGTPLKPGFFDTTLTARSSDGTTAEQPVTFIVNERSSRGLVESSGRSSPLGQPLQVWLGTAILGSNFEARGLPPGLAVAESSPQVTGTPTEIGRFEVQIEQVDPDGSERRVEFVWTIRPAIAVQFAL